MPSATYHALGWLLFALWGAALIPSLLCLWWRSLARVMLRTSLPAEWPRLSVIVPARDEAASIVAALESLLHADYPNFEVIAINDRSRDGTGRLMDELARRNERLRVIHITDLPDGWLGKNHALHVGAGQAHGEWLLFTDGDVMFSPQSLRGTVAYGVHHRLDHLCVMPEMSGGDYLERAFVAWFGVLFAAGTLAWLIPTPFRRAYIGVGAFNLVRRSAYHRAGGHVPIRMDVLDDVRLGKLIKAHGGRQDLLRGGPHLSVRWQTSAWGVIRGLEKNAFGSVDYSLPKLCLVTLVFLAMFCLPFVLPALTWLDLWDLRGSAGFSTQLSAERWLELNTGYLSTVVLLFVMYGIVGITFVGTAAVMPVMPLAAFAILFAWWRSAAMTLKQGGIRWRDTFYLLDELKRGLYR